MERVTGIEPAWPAWKAGALPLSYTRKLLAEPKPLVAMAKGIGLGKQNENSALDFLLAPRGVA